MFKKAIEYISTQMLENAQKNKNSRINHVIRVTNENIRRDQNINKTSRLLLLQSVLNPRNDKEYFSSLYFQTAQRIHAHHVYQAKNICNVNTQAERAL